MRENADPSLFRTHTRPSGLPTVDALLPENGGAASAGARQNFRPMPPECTIQLGLSAPVCARGNRAGYFSR